VSSVLVWRSGLRRDRQAGRIGPPRGIRAGSLEVHLGVEDDFRPSAKAHPGIVVADLRGLAQRLEEHGVPVVWDSRFTGFKRFYFADPFGNRLEFLEPYAEPN
jgi:hypothetical protein